MRKKLRKIDGQRKRFKAKVERFGTKSNYHGFPAPTLLLKDIKFCDNDEFAADHVWINVGNRVEKMNLSEGDIIEFDARVKQYMKGYVNHRQYIDERTTDYKLSHPSKFEKIK